MPYDKGDHHLGQWVQCHQKIPGMKPPFFGKIMTVYNMHLVLAHPTTGKPVTVNRGACSQRSWQRVPGSEIGETV